MAHTPWGIMELDPYLKSYAGDIQMRMDNFQRAKERLAGEGGGLSDFANGHLYFGFHREADGWIYREWAPGAREIYLVGDFNGWDPASHPMKEAGNGVWDIFLPGTSTLPHGSRVKVRVVSNGQSLYRIPLYIRRAVQDPASNNFDGQIWDPPTPYVWHDGGFRVKQGTAPLVYECHVGMSGEGEGIATYREFADKVLPRAKKLGYNVIQLMAVMEHPYYGSFGYQVSNFFAASSRFGTPEDLKYLVDRAHGMGLGVLLDLIHSHAASNALEGIAYFDGTDYQFTHSGGRGDHPAWGTRLFDYAKPEVIHFLLSNLKFWLEEYHFDGFRFDGVTSMLYHDHGLGAAFDHYGKYFSPNTNTDAVTYLQLAAALCREVRPHSILVAEDMSGMPGMCLPLESGGLGFDYRLGMGLPDFWVRTLKTKRDEDWNLGEMWHELGQRRPGEKVIGYCESHDQALVGDKTIMFWLADKEMYWHMSRDSQSLEIDRAVALHKLIRLVSCTCGGDGYLTFMGNEFGHPEWIDFPREGNGWSYHYARRRWSLADDPALRYGQLQRFDECMIKLVKRFNLLAHPAQGMLIDELRKVMVYTKKQILFVVNFHPSGNHTACLPVFEQQGYEVLLDTAWEELGGWKEREPTVYRPRMEGGQLLLEIPVEHRSALVLRPGKHRDL